MNVLQTALTWYKTSSYLDKQDGQRKGKNKGGKINQENKHKEDPRFSFPMLNRLLTRALTRSRTQKNDPAAHARIQAYTELSQRD
jgi:hypothetical protein